MKRKPWSKGRFAWYFNEPTGLLLGSVWKANPGEWFATKFLRDDNGTWGRKTEQHGPFTRMRDARAALEKEVSK